MFLLEEYAKRKPGSTDTPRLRPWENLLYQHEFLDGCVATSGNPVKIHAAC